METLYFLDEPLPLLETLVPPSLFLPPQLYLLLWLRPVVNLVVYDLRVHLIEQAVIILLAVDVSIVLYLQCVKVLEQIGTYRVESGTLIPARLLLLVTSLGSVDPELLGGMVVKIGSRMIDTSLKTKLNSLRIAMMLTALACALRIVM